MDAILRSKAEALIKEQITNTIMQDTPKNSIVMQLGKRLPNMTSQQTRVPVLSMLPMAYWVNGDTGYKQTSQQAWENVYIDAGELAVIVPIPEAVVNDASFDIVGEVIPRVQEEIGAKVDQAILFGINRPSNWQSDIFTMARQAGNNVTGGITYDTLLGTDGLFSKVEQAGYAVDGVIAAMTGRAAMRGIKDDAGRPIFVTDMQGATRYALDGAPMYFPENGSFDVSVAQMIAGNWGQLVYSIRQDIQTKILTEAVIQNPATKEIAYNLAQQDMIALRVTFRMGWALPNPATRLNPDRANVPFAYIEAGTPVTDYAATFTVQDSESTAVKGATVNVNGAILKTNESGKAVFHLRNGVYPYNVKASGYRTMTGEVEISGSTKDVTVKFPAKAE
ncbi:MAG TPA: phage major capsid protein [Candidatus Ruthenibacterium merdavium]|uniref:Phage major capsid protein n=1 Tax=Candidatus Ruthenibacterium merdavium TaxID=2838752 RepID=A0A9D2Q5F1_9FIRM|nr:phage major capsid protein [Candidatus Ruthenibacterium merdavium]